MTHVKFLLTLLIATLVQVTSAQHKAVFIIVDGIPADVIEKVETPVLDDIAKSSGYTRSYMGGEKGGYSESPTISAVGYNHVLTGTWTNKHNVWDNDIAAPNYNYWNIFRIAETANPSLRTAIFSSWTDNRTKLAGDMVPAAGNLKLDYAYDGLELDSIRFPHTPDGSFMSDIDDAVSTEAGKYIAANGPDLSWVYLEFTDDMGHKYGDSPAFYEAVKKADARIGKVWDAIREREQKYGEKWMIVVTTDHGRGAKTGKDHGGQSDRERTTWIVTNASPLNTRFKQNPGAVDIAPSILRFLNIPLPESVQKEMDGIPFIGEISVSNPKAIRKGNQVELTWTAINKKGDLEVLLTSTNNFQTGREDIYQSVLKVPVSRERCSLTLPSPANAVVYKILLKGEYNTTNVWLKTAK